MGTDFSESLGHVLGRLQRGGRVSRRQARVQRVVRGALSQRLSEGRRAARLRQQPHPGGSDLRLALCERVAGRDRMPHRREHRHSDRTGAVKNHNLEIGFVKIVFTSCSTLPATGEGARKNSTHFRSL